MSNIAEEKYCAEQSYLTQRMVKEIEVEKKNSRNESVRAEYAQVLNKREEQYGRDVESDYSREGMRKMLAVHNEIVLNYANELCEMNGKLLPEEKVAIVIATILHDCGKLSSGLLEHHKKGVEYAEVIVDEMIGMEFEGVKITTEIKENILRAIERHMNHPFLVGLQKGERFSEPVSEIDKTVFDADMLANIGFKNIAFRLGNSKLFLEDQSVAKEKNISVLEETFENVLDVNNGVRSLGLVVLTDAAKEKSASLILAVENIFSKMKNDGVLAKIEEDFSNMSGELDRQSTSWELGIDGLLLIKKRLNEEIQKAGMVLGIDHDIVVRFLM